MHAMHPNTPNPHPGARARQRLRHVGTLCPLPSTNDNTRRVPTRPRRPPPPLKTRTLTSHNALHIDELRMTTAGGQIAILRAFRVTHRALFREAQALAYSIVQQGPGTESSKNGSVQMSGTCRLLDYNWLYWVTLEFRVMRPWTATITCVPWLPSSPHLSVSDSNLPSSPAPGTLCTLAHPPSLAHCTLPLPPACSRLDSWTGYNLPSLRTLTHPASRKHGPPPPPSSLPHTPHPSPSHSHTPSFPILTPQLTINTACTADEGEAAVKEAVEAEEVAAQCPSTPDSTIW
jgi:hypothetical protein